MIICCCSDVNECTVKHLICEKNIKTIKELQEHINICETCLSCEDCINELIEENYE